VQRVAPGPVRAADLEPHRAGGLRIEPAKAAVGDEVAAGDDVRLQLGERTGPPAGHLELQHPGAAALVDGDPVEGDHLLGRAETDLVGRWRLRLRADPHHEVVGRRQRGGGHEQERGRDGDERAEAAGRRRATDHGEGA
jgi:hypothetical protein